MITENDKKYVYELWDCYQKGIKKLNIQNKIDEKELFIQLIQDAVKQIKRVVAEQNPSANVGYAGPGIEEGAGWRRIEVGRSDKLPMPMMDVIVYFEEYKEMEFSHWIKRKDMKDGELWSCPDNPTHWKYKPAPPEV